MKFEVREDGIYKLTPADLPPLYTDSGKIANPAEIIGLYNEELVMSKEAFIEAFEKYLKFSINAYI